MCKKNYNIPFILRVKFLFSGNISELKTKGYFLTWTRKTIPNSLKNRVFARDLYTCNYCKHQFPLTKLTIDHYIPYSVVKEHKEENLWTSCQDCNKEKGHINPIDPKHKKDWEKFNNRKITHRKTDVIEYHELLFGLEKEFIKKEYTFEQFLAQTLKLCKNMAQNPVRISFKRPTNNIIKEHHKDFWSMNNNGVFSIISIESYLNMNQRKLRLVG